MKRSRAAPVVIAVLVGSLAALAGCTLTPTPPGTGRSPPWAAGPGCAPLPEPDGPVVDVTPADAARLPSIVANAAAGTTIRLGDGTYPVTGGYEQRLRVRSAGVTIRGRSRDPTRVVIDGGYAIDALVHVFRSDVTITDLTLMRAIDHLVHVYPDDAGPDVLRLRLHRLRLVDAGEQFVKVNSNPVRSNWVDGGTISCSQFTMTAEGRHNIERAYGCYTGGIDVHAGRGWVVRANTFEGIYCEDGEVAEHAVHFWKGARDTLVENNYIRDVSRGIGLGLGDGGEGRTYPDDPYPGLYVGHYGGVVRNNVIWASIPQYDTGIELAQARGAQVLHNTILEGPGPVSSFSSIDYRFANTAVEIRDNLTRRITARDGARATLSGNVEATPASWFANAATGDVHLVESAGARDSGTALAGAGFDLDGTRHDAGPPDVGADEYRP